MEIQKGIAVVDVDASKWDLLENRANSDLYRGRTHHVRVDIHANDFDLRQDVLLIRNNLAQAAQQQLACAAPGDIANGVYLPIVGEWMTL